ncbi:P-selectin-like [Dysidea avara]|uniref:P-selectin-like n=1 Tax=Dysidea avara TaxID=196820 RepID=UPI00332DB16E
MELIYAMIVLICSVQCSGQTVSCSSLSHPTHGRIICSLGSDRVYSEGDKCFFTCNTGYRLTGSETRTCQSGRWSGSTTRCTRVTCSSISYPTNGWNACRSGSYYYATTCSFICNTGYDLTGSNTRTCLISGSWSSDSPTCSKVSCPSLAQPINGRRSSCSNNYGDRCTFSCNTGYKLTGSVTRTCQSNRNWDGTETMCRRVHCPPLTNLNNGVISCFRGDDGILSYQDTCRFTCNTGYRQSGSSQRTCQYDGSWSGSPVSCSIMECSSSSLPMNSLLTHCHSRTYLSRCDLQCEEGFVGRGNPLYECKVFSGGVAWRATGSSWICTKVTCSSLTDPNNGMITCSLGNNRVPSYEDTCSFTCNTGYELTGSVTRTCQSDGSWSGNETMCSRVSCPSLTNPNNGTITCSLGDDEVPSYEDTCSFTCNTGYDLTGTNPRNCQSNGSWRGAKTNCRRVSCPTLTDPNNGTINCSLGDDGVPSYEDICNFTCNTGYELTGSENRICLSNGSWSDIETTCTALVDDSSVLGAAVGGTIVFLLIAILVLLLIIVWMRRKLQLNNEKSSEGNNTTVPGSAIPVDPHDVSKPQKENDEDIFGWFGEHPPCHDTKKHVKMNANPSYGKVITEETNTTDSQVTTGSNVAITPNPAYGGVA